MTDVQLLVNGDAYGGWKSVRITAGIDRVARDFALGVTYSWPGSELPRRIRAYDRCELWVDGDKVLTGIVDATPISYSATEVTVEITGRSLTGQLVDCAALHGSGQWRGASPEDIARQLASAYGIEVRAEVPLGRALEHTLEPGESAFECIDRLISGQALLATDDAEGRLVLTRAGRLRAADALVLGENIITGAAPLDGRERFSEYRIRGQRAGGDHDFGAAVAHGSASTLDKGVPIRRVLELRPEGGGDLQSYRDRLRWEAAHRAAKFYEVTYVVAGWRQRSGQLWQPNMLAWARDQVAGFDMEMLISEVEYSLGDDYTATLRMAPSAAYELLPEVPSARAKGGVLKPGETLVEFK